ncbi:MAG: ParB/RepB/Spo0J family partition protein [Sedimentisphaerales bacterium]
MYIPKTIIRVPIDKLFGHPENPNKMSRGSYEKLKRHIGQTHNYEPLIVRKHPDIEGGFEIINGHHRAQALGELGESFADCIEWDVDDDQTRILLATLNRLGGKDELSAKIDLIKNLSGKFNSKELAKLLPDTKTVIEKLKGIEAQIKNEQSMAAWAKSPPYETEMPNSIVFFLNDEQMRIVEVAIEAEISDVRYQTSDGKETRAEKMAKAITAISREFLSFIAKE